MSATDLTMEEFSETITGYEEIAIAKHFGEDWSTLPETKPTMFMRALIMVDQSRAGKNAKDAKDHAMALALKAANEYFAEDPEEPNPEDPVTDSGKDASPLEDTPRSLPASAS